MVQHRIKGSHSQKSNLLRELQVMRPLPSPRHVHSIIIQPWCSLSQVSPTTWVVLDTPSKHFSAAWTHSTNLGSELCRHRFIEHKKRGCADCQPATYNNILFIFIPPTFPYSLPTILPTPKLCSHTFHIPFTFMAQKETILPIALSWKCTRCYQPILPLTTILVEIYSGLLTKQATVFGMWEGTRATGGNCKLGEGVNCTLRHRGQGWTLVAGAVRQRITWCTSLFFALFLVAWVNYQCVHAWAGRVNGKRRVNRQ